MSINQITPFVRDIQDGGPQATHCFFYGYEFIHRQLQHRWDSRRDLLFGNLRGWTWHINELQKPNIRPSFNYPDDMEPGPVAWPATKIQKRRPLTNVTFGVLIELKAEMKAELKRNESDYRLSFVQKMIVASLQADGSIRPVPVKALVYWDPYYTADLHHKTPYGQLSSHLKIQLLSGLNFLESRSIPREWLAAIWRRIAGEQIEEAEPLFLIDSPLVEQVETDQQEDYQDIQQMQERDGRELQHQAHQQERQPQDQNLHERQSTPLPSSPILPVHITSLSPQRQRKRVLPQVSTVPRNSSPKPMMHVVKSNPSIQGATQRPSMKKAPDARRIREIKARQEANRIAHVKMKENRGERIINQNNLHFQDQFVERMNQPAENRQGESTQVASAQAVDVQSGQPIQSRYAERIRNGSVQHTRDRAVRHNEGQPLRDERLVDRVNENHQVQYTPGRPIQRIQGVIPRQHLMMQNGADVDGRAAQIDQINERSVLVHMHALRYINDERLPHPLRNLLAFPYSSDAISDHAGTRRQLMRVLAGQVIGDERVPRDVRCIVAGQWQRWDLVAQLQQRARSDDEANYAAHLRIQQRQELQLQAQRAHAQLSPTQRMPASLEDSEAVVNSNAPAKAQDIGFQGPHGIVGDLIENFGDAVDANTQTQVQSVLPHDPLRRDEGYTERPQAAINTNTQATAQDTLLQAPAGRIRSLSEPRAQQVYGHRLNGQEIQSPTEGFRAAVISYATGHAQHMVLENPAARVGRDSILLHRSPLRQSSFQNWIDRQGRSIAQYHQAVQARIGENIEPRIQKRKADGENDLGLEEAKRMKMDEMDVSGAEQKSRLTAPQIHAEHVQRIQAHLDHIKRTEAEQQYTSPDEYSQATQQRDGEERQDFTVNTMRNLDMGNGDRLSKN